MNIISIDNFNFDLETLITEYEHLSASVPFEHHSTGKKIHLVKFRRTYVDLSTVAPYTLSMLECMKQFIDFDCVTYRVLNPHGAYNWHTDEYPLDHCYHIPLITNELCKFIYRSGDEFIMPVGKLYKAQTNILHTFKNAGSTNRVHITFEKQMS